MASQALLYFDLCKISCITALHSNYRMNRYGLFFVAIEYNFIDVVKYLIEKNTDVNLLNTIIFRGREYHYTPLMIASKFNRYKIIEILLDNGALINYQMPHWLYTALHIAVKNNNVYSVIVLLSRGADVNLKNLDGYTALHKAIIYRRCKKIIKLLLQYNADIGIRDNTYYRIPQKGYTPFDIVNQYYDYNTLELLTSHIIRIDRSNSKSKLTDGFKHNKELIKKSKTLSDIEKKCISDMEKMKNIIINKQFTLFDGFVNNDIDSVANYGKRYDLKILINDLTIYKELYSDYIDSCISRTNLLKESMHFIDSIHTGKGTSWNDLPYEIRFNILKYLTNDELRRATGNSLLTVN
ncbi:SWPV1-040 [Shearwaterpox virus]|uniref:SWPV1-040 n=1 Tax=Shearwaterpox virus TaxID=1974596 RepID=A0A1V0S7Q4_CNPV|nr:SWPV1-040 [Shearwaterpox virus]